MTSETFTFQTEVSKLLDIVAHSLYSHKEIFLRELISNASDACDRLRYDSLTKPELIDGDGVFKITLAADKAARTLSITDNGVGMNRDDLIATLGTIASSGTQAFVGALSGDAAKDTQLIGQFGVGFYSAFMVSDTVEVLTRRAGEAEAWRWTSDGKGAFEIEPAERESRGTTVILHLAKGEDEYLEETRLRTIVKTYSDHIGVPIVMAGSGDDGAEQALNEGSALWTRAKKDITDEQYTEFYHHVGHVFDEPWMVLHNAVEGVLSYTNLLFIPSSPPFDLYDPDRKPRVKLYVKRVFITDDCEGLLPSYLRFLRGVVDSEDLSLNISREMLQNDPKLAKIRSGLVKRVLGELKKKAEKAPDDYAAFWTHFGPLIKEGIYEDFANRDALLALARFRSTGTDDWTTLADYVGRMKEGQDAIYMITGDDLDSLKRSPQLEGFRAKGVEVLLLSDPVDEFWTSSVPDFEGKPFKSVTRGGADLDKVKAPEDQPEADKPEAAPDAEMDKLIAAFKIALGEAVKDVRVSQRLTDSAVCLVADEGDMDIHLERILKQHRQFKGGLDTPRILELNPGHALIKGLAHGAEGGEDMADAAFLLLDQARILEGEPVADAPAFARRLAAVMEKGL
ncbi:MAG: molecular chaperone HtpG [Rhodobacterales bacterium]|nr:molecular chaperone HtpG [Rhodobacterales bacterium]